MTDKNWIDESEWAAQERGMRAALGRDAGELDATALDYRAVADAFISAPRSEPPNDFVVDVVKRVARSEAGIERLLSRILLAAFLFASVIVGLLFGEQWWHALRQPLGDDAPGWILTGVGCISLSWICSRVLELTNHTSSARRVA